MFKKALYTIDLFGLSPMMNFAGREKSKTKFGGFCSLLFYSFAAWSLFNGSKDLFSKVNPKTISSQSNNENPPNLTIGPDTFPIAIQVQKPDPNGLITFMDDSIYTLNIFLSRAVRVMNNGVAEKVWTNTKLTIERCTADHFGQELYEVYLKLFEIPMYCIARNQSQVDEIYVSGVWDLPFYQRILVELSPCDNNTSPITCAPREKIETYLSGGYVNVIYNNMVVNPNNYDRPNGAFQDNYYKIMSFANYYETFIDLGKVQVSTDAGWLVEDIDVKNYTNIARISEAMLGKAHPRGLLFSISFQLSKLETFYSRRYKKIPDVLAEVAGLTNTAMLVLLILTTPYLTLKLKESLINEIFDVRLSPPQTNTNKTKAHAQHFSEPSDNKEILRKSFNEPKTPSQIVSPVKNQRKTKRWKSSDFDAKGKIRKIPKADLINSTSLNQYPRHHDISKYI